MERQPLGADAPQFLTQPPDSLAGWVQAFDTRELPVLRDSALLLEDLRLVEEEVDAHTIADGIGDDPLMTLKLLRHVAQLRKPATREHSDAETTVEALVMLGITPFFRHFGPQPTIEERLRAQPLALLGLRNVLSRASRAARFALGFAAHRLDHDAAVIHEAALLHDFTELLLWAHAPTLALEVTRRLEQDHDLRSVDAQRSVLNVTLGDLQQALMKRWHLPDLLVRISDDHASENAQVRNVQLAIRVARHSAHGWDNPALPDDVDAIAQLLNLGTTPTWTLLHDLDR
ncbi:HDOD domain-containing protein [Ideonella sp. DXS22W]|uniref:HDOD domain-containing protein n=1 Tax=Pseudaquabacterium inlustre TaxID=2984192 RepID=A0ABU9CCS1_9BURK